MKNRMNKNLWYKRGYMAIMYVFLAALMVFVSIFNKDSFTLGDFKNPLRSFFPLLMAALGQTLIIPTEGIDLSLEGIVALCNVVYVLSMNPGPAWGSVPALGAAATVGLAYGAASSVLVIRGHLASIIVAMATTAVFDGMTSPFMPNPGGGVHKAFAKFLTQGYPGAAPFLLFILIPCLVRRLTNSTPYGKALRVIGGSENAAYSTGTWVGKTKLRAYCLAGLLCAMTGVPLSTQVNSADAVIGKSYAMNAITITIVGGAAMTGAAEDPLRTIAGVFIISVINSMLNLFGTPSFYQLICQDPMLIIIPSLGALHKRRQGLWGLII